MSDPTSQIPSYKLHGVGDIETLSQIFPQNITGLKIPNIWKRTQGKGVMVAVLDTGIQLHSDLVKNVDISRSRSFIEGENIFDTTTGHGVHVSGIVAAQNDNKGIVGVAPQATIVSIKVLNKFGSSQGDSIVQGLKYCVQLQPDVINLSLGSVAPLPEAHKVIKELHKNGVIIVASAGNNGNEHILYPAAYDEVIAVGASSSSFMQDRATFSSYGHELDIMAPGEEIFSTFLDNKFAVMSGTSQAAPHVSGIVALLLSYHKNQNITLTPTQVRKMLLDNTLDTGDKGFDNHNGWGLIDPEKLFTNMLGEVIPKKKSFWQRIKSLFKHR